MRDPYVYNEVDEQNGQSTLKNKLNIHDYAELNKAEAEIGFLKLIDIDKFSNEKTGPELYKAIHKHIFEDIFDWAGEYRTVPVFKEELIFPGYSIPYSEPKNIKKELTARLKALDETNWNIEDIDELCFTFARQIALVWRVHPFRDGNTRTTLSYAYIFAKQHGFEFDMNLFADSLNRKYIDSDKINLSVRDKFAFACVDEDLYPEVDHLAMMFKDAIKVKEEKKNKTR